jgi:hypothetical protein
MKAVNRYNHLRSHCVNQLHQIINFCMTTCVQVNILWLFTLIFFKLVENSAGN